MTNELDWEQTLFTFILHAGNARSKAKEAAGHAEAGGQPVPFSVLLVHAMDLLLLAWSELDYTEQYIAMCKRVRQLEADVAELRGAAKGAGQ